ncbi:MAG: OmpH family outer membrane protein [Opitutaceae bacterium]|nr:OmpH family outer membrane protein [Cytophagales bacterium]
MTKNVSLIINCILIVAVGILYYLHFKPAPATATSTVEISDSTSGPAITIPEDQIKKSGIVYVNTDTLLKYYDFYNSAKKNLENRQKKAESSLGASYNAIQSEVMEFQKKAQAGTLTQEEGARKEQELMAKQQQFLASKETQMGALVAEEQKLSEQLNKKVQEYVTRFCKGKDYQFVLGYTGMSSNVLFKNDSLDITQPILKGLNEEYRKK